MPIIFEGEHICEKCQKSFNWCYFDFFRRHRNGVSDVDTIPNGKNIAHHVYPRGNVYSVEINCPHCDYENRFDYQKK